MVPSIVPPSPPPATELLSVGAAQKTRVRRIAGFLGGGELDAALASLLALRSTLHEVAAGGALPDPDHYDSGSYATIDVMLSAPGVDFEGGHFETLEADGSFDRPVFDRGDALVFCSHKKHCVRPVTKGTRRVLVLEVWFGPHRTCGHRCERREGRCGFARHALALAGCLRLGRDDAAADGDEYKRAVAELERRVAAAAPAEAARAPRKKKKKAKALPATWHGHAMPMLWFALDAVDAHDAPATGALRGRGARLGLGRRRAIAARAGDGARGGLDVRAAARHRRAAAAAGRRPGRRLGLLDVVEATASTGVCAPGPSATAASTRSSPSARSPTVSSRSSARSRTRRWGPRAAPRSPPAAARAALFASLAPQLPPAIDGVGALRGLDDAWLLEKARRADRGPRAAPGHLHVVLFLSDAPDGGGLAFLRPAPSGLPNEVLETTVLPRPGAALAFPGDDHPMAPITETPANAETFAYAARLRVIYG
ncbi:hypothetical protein JL720_5261 [Aureococcus anophagefferens]|nr:hypothetical protein JL720_5261 [Aureococcus anophagefferens]